jgi:hypothetical protein
MWPKISQTRSSFPIGIPLLEMKTEDGVSLDGLEGASFI